MRSLALLPLLVLAACGGAEAEQKTADTTNLKMTAGKWALASEVTSVDSLDKTPPAIKAAVGDKGTAEECLAATDLEKPQPTLFVGNDMGECKYDSFYMSRGRLNAAVGCKKEGLVGNIQVSVEGTYTADSFDVLARTQTALAGPGDVAIARKVKGSMKTAGACQANVT